MSEVKMPPREAGAVLVPLDDDGLTVGKVPVAGVGLRVGMMTMGTLALMSPAKARRIARDFETPEAIAAELGWVAFALRQCADEIEGVEPTRQ
jgi:hypothetical protein